MITKKPSWPVVALALAALMLQSFASVHAVVMMAAVSVFDDAAPICSEHIHADDAPESGTISPLSATRVIAAATHGSRSGVPHGQGWVCPFCVASCHVPLVAFAPPLQASAVVAFVAFQLVSGDTPRGPPACEHRARSPPVIPLTT